MSVWILKQAVSLAQGLGRFKGLADGLENLYRTPVKLTKGKDLRYPGFGSGHVVVTAPVAAREVLATFLKESIETKYLSRGFLGDGQTYEKVVANTPRYTLLIRNPSWDKDGYLSIVGTPKAIERLQEAAPLLRYDDPEKIKRLNQNVQHLGYWTTGIVTTGVLGGGTLFAMNQDKSKRSH
jgi:hypothetical protein